MNKFTYQSDSTTPQSQSTEIGSPRYIALPERRWPAFAITGKDPRSREKGQLKPHQRWYLFESVAYPLQEVGSPHLASITEYLLSQLDARVPGVFVARTLPKDSIKKSGQAAINVMQSRPYKYDAHCEVLLRQQGPNLTVALHRYYWVSPGIIAGKLHQVLTLVPRLLAAATPAMATLGMMGISRWPIHVENVSNAIQVLPMVLLGMSYLFLRAGRLWLFLALTVLSLILVKWPLGHSLEDLEGVAYLSAVFVPATNLVTAVLCSLVKDSLDETFPSINLAGDPESKSLQDAVQEILSEFAPSPLPRRSL